MYVLTDKYAYIATIVSVLLLIITFYVSDSLPIFKIFNIVISIIFLLFGIYIIIQNLYFIFVFTLFIVSMMIIGVAISCNMLFFLQGSDDKK